MSSNVMKAEPARHDISTDVRRQSVSTKKVAFFGIFGVQNLGNECTLQAILHHARMRFGDRELFAISFKAADTAARHHLPAFPVTWQDFSQVSPGSLAKFFRIVFKRVPGELLDWAKAVRRLRGTGLLVMTGTGMLTDYSTHAFGYPYHVFRWALAARLAGCKVRFVGVGVGPLYELMSRCFVRWALRLADYRSFRDEFSRNRISNVFDSSRDHVFPDLAFSLPQNIFPVPPSRPHHKRQIGLGIMDHRDIHQFTSAEQETAYFAYLNKMCEFVEWLVRHGYEVRILQGDAKHDVAPRAELRSRLEARGIAYGEAGIIDEGSSSVEELLSQLAQVDIVMSPRFHNLLLGLMMNIPAISISYDPKSDALLEGIGLGKYRQELFSLDVKLLIRQLMEMEENLEDVKPMIRKRVNQYRRLLENQYDWIFGDLQFGGSKKLVNG
jgi:polysaccharide pyruvyl transferase WcaK-like protein